MSKKKKARGIDGDAFLAAQLSDPRVRHHFEQRRIVHEVAVAVDDGGLVEVEQPFRPYRKKGAAATAASRTHRSGGSVRRA